MPHKEIIEYEGQKIEVITYDTEVHPNQPIAKIMKEIDSLIDEDEQYQKDGKLTRNHYSKSKKLEVGMRDYKQEFKEIGCSGDFEKERLEEKSDCLKCYLSDYCGSIFEEAQRAEWDAKTPEERAAQEKLSKGLKELY